MVCVLYLILFKEPGSIFTWYRPSVENAQLWVEIFFLAFFPVFKYEHLNPTLTTMDNVTVTGSDAVTIALLFDLLAAGGTRPWIVWDATTDAVPDDLQRRAGARVLTYKARAYAAECQILVLHRVVDHANTDYVWSIDADILLVKDLKNIVLDDPRTEDVLLGDGYSRFSRKALECVSRDFGTGLDYSQLAVSTL